MTLTYNFNGDDFEYDLSAEDIYDYLSSMDRSELLEMIYDIVDSSDLFDYLQEDLESYFEDDARDQYDSTKDPLGYYGMKQSDFI